MSEDAVIERTQAPITLMRLVDDLSALGLRSGDAVLAHCSLSQIGWVLGGARTVVDALMIVGPNGLLAMPAFTSDLSDPAEWRDPPVPDAWLETIRDGMPPFERTRTPSRGVGQIAELFRSWPGVMRSEHPQTSITAWGRGSEEVVKDHSLAFSLGDATPMGKLYARDAKILLLGVGHNRNSSLHLAESRAQHGRKTQKRLPVPCDDHVVWETVWDVEDDDERLFPKIGAAFEATGAVRVGPVGETEARLMSMRALVDFAATWLDRELAPPP